MPQSPFAPSESARQRWQFSIRGILIFTASVAIGFSAMKINKNCWFGSHGITRSIDDLSNIKTDWCGGLIVALCFWFGFGLLHQIRDLRTCLASHPELDKEQRRGGKFEIAWRVAILAIFGLYAVNAIFMDRRIYTLHEEINLLLEPGPMIREGIFGFLMLVLVGSVPRICRESASSSWRTVLKPTACLLAIGLCLLQWMNFTWFEYEIHFSFLGYANSFPLVYAAFDANRYPGLASLLFWWSVVSGVAVILNYMLLNRLAKQWSQGIGARLRWLGFLFVGIAFVSGYAIWILTRGLQDISPYLAEAGNLSSRHAWCAAIAFLVVLATMLAYRLTVDRLPTSEGRQISWRTNPNKYFGEWRLILLLFAIALIVAYFYDLYQTFEDLGFFRWGLLRSFRFRGIPQIIMLVVFTPPNMMWLAVIFLTLHRAFCSRPDPNQPQVELPRLNWAKFITIWLASAAFTVSGSLALVWMSFGLWFNPWFSGR